LGVDRAADKPKKCPRYDGPVICRNCGTEIADKALICYRCGMATAEPRVKPSARPPAGRGGIAALLALVVLAVAGLFMSVAAHGAFPREAGYVVAALAVIAIVWRVIRTRVR